MSNRGVSLPQKTKPQNQTLQANQEIYHSESEEELVLNEIGLLGLNY
jgi:hypothetical protein